MARRGRVYSMKIAVCVKHAVDEVELKADSGGKPILSGAAAKMSTFDKNAVEEGLRMKAKLGGEVVIFTVGDASAKKTVREALAMGADRAVHIVSDPFGYDSLGTSFLLAEAIKKSGPFDVVLCSEGSSDTYTGQVAPMLGEWLSFAYVGYSSKIELEQGGAKIQRSLEENVETVEVSTPFVASVVSEINEPRYPTLIQIMQASKKPLEETSAGPMMKPDGPLSSTRVLGIAVQSVNRKRVALSGSPEEEAGKLVDALKKEGVLAK
jgi:electron transfer flavoprotein beta subunit